MELDDSMCYKSQTPVDVVIGDMNPLTHEMFGNSIRQMMEYLS